MPPKNKLFNIANYNYHLPEAHIAQAPVSPRDHCQLLVLDKVSGKIQHQHFYDLLKYLHQGDVLVFNDSKVIPARLQGKKETGGKLEVFLLEQKSSKQWECLVRGKIKIGQKIFFPQNFIGEVIKKNENGILEIKFNKVGILKIGETPLPPYIKKKSSLDKYQTVYAKAAGSVAAPTAGLHFTKALLAKLKKQGVQLEYVTLHVGLGTFAPVKEEDITEHQIHTEYFSINKPTLARLQKAKAEGRRIITVGTTATRTLESLKNLAPRTYKLESTQIYIYPGYKFKFVDGIITNFHLPKSSLIMLVSAFAGLANIQRAYKIAIKNKYRFYSFGDAMLIVSPRLTPGPSPLIGEGSKIY